MQYMCVENNNTWCRCVLWSCSVCQIFLLIPNSRQKLANFLPSTAITAWLINFWWLHTGPDSQQANIWLVEAPWLIIEDRHVLLLILCPEAWQHYVQSADMVGVSGLFSHPEEGNESQKGGQEFMKGFLVEEEFKFNIEKILIPKLRVCAWPNPSIYATGLGLFCSYLMNL